MQFQFKFSINTLTILLLINAIIFALGYLLIGSGTNISNESFIEVFQLLGGLIPIYVITGQPWLMLTSGFFHLEIWHFLLNMYALYRFGQLVEYYFGGKVLFLTYIFGALGGSFLTILAGDLSLSLGASGAIFALIGLLIGGTLKRYRYGIELPFSLLDFLPIVILTFGLGITPNSQINNWAHLGGLLTGIAFGLVLKHSFGAFKTKFDKYLETTLFSVALVIFILSYLALIYNFVRVIFLS